MEIATLICLCILILSIAFVAVVVGILIIRYANYWSRG